MTRKRGDGLFGDERMVVVGCAVDPDVRRRLKRMARDADCSISSVVRDLIGEALQRREAQAAQTQATNAVA